MIQTRDFLLYVLALVVIVLAIGVTLIVNQPSHHFDLASQPRFNEPVAQQVVEHNESTDMSALGRMREKIAEGEGQIISAPPVMTSVDTPEPPVEVSIVRYCNVIAPNASVTDWPLKTELRVTTSMYQVIGTSELIVPNGSSTDIVVEEFPVQLIPRNSEAGAYKTCLPDTTIGVTAAGQPLDNRAVSTYISYSSTDLVGYTRDGFPVYGPVTNGEKLDTCGGVQTPTGYQYHLRPDATGIISCYSQIPAVFK